MSGFFKGLAKFSSWEIEKATELIKDLTPGIKEIFKTKFKKFFNFGFWGTFLIISLSYLAGNDSLTKMSREFFALNLWLWMTVLGWGILFFNIFISSTFKKKECKELKETCIRIFNFSCDLVSLGAGATTYGFMMVLFGDPLAKEEPVLILILTTLMIASYALIHLITLMPAYYIERGENPLENTPYSKTITGLLPFIGISGLLFCLSFLSRYNPNIPPLPF